MTYLLVANKLASLLTYVEVLLHAPHEGNADNLNPKPRVRGEELFNRIITMVIVNDNNWFEEVPAAPSKDYCHPDVPGNHFLGQSLSGLFTEYIAQ